MRVTDCGCFGDFIKLEPKISFLKDVILLIPAFFFIYKYKDFHSIFNGRIRTAILSISLTALFIYCLSNYVSDIPHMDFRPFKKGADIATQKQLETEAQANVKVLGFKLSNKETGEKKDVEYNKYLANMANYPSDIWSVDDQIVSEPSMPLTKISDYDIMDLAGYQATDLLLHDKESYFMIVCHKLYGRGSPATRVLEDTIFTLDTIYNDTYDKGFIVEKNVQRIEKQTVNYTNYLWKDYYSARFENIVNPFVAEAKKDGIKTVAVIGGADQMMVEDFHSDVGLDAMYYTADDILLKTIVRSNPGIVLWKNGKILNKWHYRKLPSYTEVKKEHLE